MTKQELLTKLATECATWKAVTALGNAERRSQSQRNPGGCPFTITYPDWLAERERLLNKPSWSEAPERATHLSMDGGGRWAFCFNDGTNWRYAETGAEYIATLAIAIPAGYDWKESLEVRPV